MKFPLDVFPDRTGSSHQNMATDFMMLQRYPAETHLRFRHYGWNRPAFTFGFSQKLEYVRAHLPVGESVEICRRPTGGGIVDHRNDWTYALVVPRGHPAYDARAIDTYRIVHSALAEALAASGQPATLQETCEKAPGAPACGPGVCFAKPELYDVIEPTSGRKIAGAAQKRNKHGQLFQGSIERAAVTAVLNWEGFKSSFLSLLGQTLNAETIERGWPDWSEEELDGLTQQYSEAEWNEFR